MKLKRDQFKNILKECIVELIGEGAFDKIISESLHSAASARPAANDFVSSNTNENPHAYGMGQLTPNERLKEIANHAAMLSSGNDPKRASMLASIFEDTAKTTLQKTLAAENGGYGSTQMFVGEQVSPEELKAEQVELEVLSQGRGTNHWAALAFGRYSK